MKPSPNIPEEPRLLRSSSKGVPILLLVGGIWLVMLGGDWLMRFRWFQWQTNLWVTPGTVALAPGSPNLDREVPASRGGDLTRLMGLPPVAREFETERPTFRERSDEFGFRNVPPVSGRSFPIVVVGDSYVVAGDTPTNTLNAELESVSGVPSYNYGYAGRGPLFSMVRFYWDERFQEARPKVVVWTLVEREIGGDILTPLLYYLEAAESTNATSMTAAKFNWRALSPASLKKTLPASSALAQLGAKVWNRLRYALFRQITPDLAISQGEVAGRRILFYSHAVTAMKWDKSRRKPEKMIEAITTLNARLQERGMTLVILLIPDKEQVYRDLLPRTLRPTPESIPPSTLNDVAEGLAEKGVRVVNMLPVFEERAARGELLYWPDDTHWNGRGIRLAAETAWGAVADLFADGAGKQ